MRNGFDATKLYQLVYTVKDPYVLGAGTAAFRDVRLVLPVRARRRLRHGNPLAGQVKWAIIRGVSQSGNFTRHFIFLGMNEDEAGRIVHDGAWPLIAGRRVANNSRWGQPDGVLELYQMGSEGPQWWHSFPDRVRDLHPGGILDRCKRHQHLPEDRRDVRRRGSVRAEDDAVVGRHRSEERHPAARQRAPLLPAELDARRRQRRDGREHPSTHRRELPGQQLGHAARCARTRCRRRSWSTACASRCATG